MLEWLDQVTADSARAAIAVALDEISDDDADLGVVAAAAADAARLMKSAKSDERAGLEERRAAIEALLADVAAKHAAALAESPDAARPDAPFGPWAAHFRIAERHLGSVPAWQAATKELRKKAAAHDKAAGAAIKALGKPSSSAFSTAMKAIDSAFLSTDYDDLVADTRRIAGSPPKGVAPQRLAELEELIGGRAEQEASGAEAAAAITREPVARFRADHAAWFE
jgi:hypothetical protein